MWSHWFWKAFRYVAAIAGGVYLTRHLFASVDTGLWRPGLESAFLIGSLLPIPVALLLAAWIARLFKETRPRARDAVSGVLVFLSMVFITEVGTSLNGWHRLRYWRTNAEVLIAMETDYAERYATAANRQSAFDDHAFAGTTFEHLVFSGPRPHDFVPDRLPDRILWGVQRVQRRTAFTSRDASMTAAVIGTLSAAWSDVPITLRWPPGLAGRQEAHTVIMTEIWSRHQQADGSMGWTLLEAEVSITPKDR